MKKYLLILLSLVVFTPYIVAQGPKDKDKMREEIQKFKIDFLAKEMELTEAEKAKFGPIYNEYDEAKRNAGEKAWLFERELKKKQKTATDDDYNKLSKLQLEAREKVNGIDKKYNKKFETILTAKQIYLMHQGEEKFFSKMKKMREKHKPGKDKKPGKPRKDPKNHPGEVPGMMPPPAPHFDF